MKQLIVFILLTGLLAGCTTTKYVDTRENTVKACSVLKPEVKLNLIDPPALDDNTIALIQAALETEHRLFKAFGSLIKWYELNQQQCEHQFKMMSHYAQCIENGGYNE